jgi:hypothetical protein
MSALVKKEHWLYGIAVAVGVVVWVVVSEVSGRREAWDSPLYFSVGIPVLYVLTACLAYVEPDRSWR